MQVARSSIIDVDRLYASFCASLPSALRALARDLAFELQLSPVRGVPWSKVFNHQLTLHAPLFVCERICTLRPELCERAVLAHLLAVIEAFGRDRIADGQAHAHPVLTDVLAHMRQVRDTLVFELGGESAQRAAHVADATTRDAIAAERRVFGAGVCVDLATYRAISARKQAVGLIASVALGRAVGLTESALTAIHDALLAVCLGLQCQDDVADWEDDATRGGAWALLLADGPGRPVAGIERAQLLTSGALARMLALAAAEYERGAAAAQHLGATRLVDWFAKHHAGAIEQQQQETRSPGYIARREKLRVWLREVL